MISKLKETNGAIAVNVIILMVFLLPFAIWLGIELPKSHEYNQRVKDAVDSASASAITSVQTERIHPNLQAIPLDEPNAERIAMQIFASKMGLDIKVENGDIVVTPPEDSLITDAVLEVQVLDEDDGVGISVEPIYVETKNGKKRINHSTVIVTGTVTFDSVGFLGREITVTHVGMSQAKVNPNK